MPRRRHQKGHITNIAPASGSGPARKLRYGEWYCEWRRYEMRDGREIRKRRSKIVDRNLAHKLRVKLDYDGPLTKTDARRVLEMLIAEESGAYIPPDRAATLADVAREWLDLAKASWSAHTLRAQGNVVTAHVIGGSLGNAKIADISTDDVQEFLNSYIESDSSASLLGKLVYTLRSTFAYARAKHVIAEDPTRNPLQRIKARSRKRAKRWHLSVAECRTLLSSVDGPNRLIIRMFLQLALRPGELFALRVGNIEGTRIHIERSLCEGRMQKTKTAASENDLYLPAGLRKDLAAWVACSKNPDDLIFSSATGGPIDAHNYLNRVLKPAGILAKIRMRQDEEGNVRTDLDFRALRRTAGTLFGRHSGAADVQRLLRHEDPTISLRHYQQSLPESVVAAADALETDLFEDMGNAIPN